MSTRSKVTRLTLRLILVMTVLSTVFGVGMQPIFAVAADGVTELLFPARPSQLLNTGGETELIWWRVEFTTTPVWMVHIIQDPHGTIVDTDTFDITNEISPVYNPEDPTGAHQGDGNATFAHHWDVPAGAEPGTYTSRVEYFSTTSLNGSPVDTDPITGNWDQQAAQRFDVVQPLAIMKYHDLNGNGDNDGATDPGLANWHFDVSGPGWVYSGSVDPAGSPAPTTTVFAVKDLTPQFPLTGTGLLVNNVNVGAYTLSSVDTLLNTGVITLSVAMGSPPSNGQPIRTSFTTFSGDTDSGGLIVLPLLQAGGDYIVTETLQSGWANTDPPGAAPVQKIIHVPGDIGPNPGQISPTAPIVYFGNMQVTPDTILTMSANPMSLPVDGGNTTLTINEFNNGDLPIHAISVAVISDAASPYGSFTLTKLGPNPAGTIFSGDTGNDGILGVGETWQWVIPNIPIIASTHFVAIADGLDIFGAHVNPSTGHEQEQAALDITVRPPTVPASSNPGLWLLIALFAGLVTVFVYRRTTHTQR